MTADLYFPRNTETSVVRIIYLFIHLVNISYTYNTVCLNKPKLDGKAYL